MFGFPNIEVKKLIRKMIFFIYDFHTINLKENHIWLNLVGNLLFFTII